jgi:hypothetical protein
MMAITAPNARPKRRASGDTGQFRHRKSAVNESTAGPLKPQLTFALQSSFDFGAGVGGDTLLSLSVAGYQLACELWVSSWSGIQRLGTVEGADLGVAR